jgi:hypothetical protein
MPCEHTPFIPQLLSDYKRRRLGHWVSPLLPGFGAERISPNPRRGWLAIVAKRYASPTDPRITYTRELPWADSAMSSDFNARNMLLFA